MSLLETLASRKERHAAWRRDLHAHPQTAFEETYASEFICRRLAEFGIPFVRGLAGTGVVATLQGEGGFSKRPGALRTIALRADIDALDIEEQTGLPWRSQNPGKMHACGHDGHTTMLLAAAEYLAEHRAFAGTVHFIFQPAEENEGGAKVMCEAGLFRDFPAEAVFGLHNWPGMPVGGFAIRSGPMMAAFDVFEITVQGHGTHAALPHHGVDPIVAAAQIATALQTIASREANPLEPLVVSITQIHAGDTWNVIPERAVLKGTVRSFDRTLQERAEASMRRIVTHTAQALGAVAELRYERRYPATVNSERETEWAAEAAADVAVGRVDRTPSPCMGSEDFAFMLRECPGSYIWMGNGPSDGGRQLHNPHYDFNDDAIPYGAAWWIRLVQRLL